MTEESGFIIRLISKFKKMIDSGRWYSVKEVVEKRLLPMFKSRNSIRNWIKTKHLKAIKTGVDVGIRYKIKGSWLIEFIAKWESGDFNCSDRTSNNYVSLYDPTHPACTKAGYVREHRIVMEKYLGRYLSGEEIVHHINGKKWDNRVENLKVFESDKQHRRIHNGEK